jgi:hypothetical protein
VIGRADLNWCRSLFSDGQIIVSTIRESDQSSRAPHPTVANAPSTIIEAGSRRLTAEAIFAGIIGVRGVRSAVNVRSCSVDWNTDVIAPPKAQVYAAMFRKRVSNVAE